MDAFTKKKPRSKWDFEGVKKLQFKLRVSRGSSGQVVEVIRVKW